MAQESATPGDEWTKLEQGAQSLCFCIVVFLVVIGIASQSLAIGIASLSLAVLYLAFRVSNDGRS